MKHFIQVLLLSLACNLAWAQDILYGSGGEIEINYNDEYGIHFLHTVEAGHTLYGLSRVFHIPPARIKLYNKMSADADIRLGQILRIPFDDELLYKGVDLRDFSNATFLPVYYSIKPKETLYRVSKVYFEQEAKTILQRNGLAGDQLQIGQKLLMGWIPLDSKATLAEDAKLDAEIKQKTETPVLSQLTRSDTMMVAESESQIVDDSSQMHKPIAHIPTPPQQSETGLAYWNKHGSDKENLFVLHPTARINSLIEIYNPQLQRRTFAKVIARIPEGTYSDRIDVLVSPRVAMTLGALNTEFRVKMRYFE